MTTRPRWEQARELFLELADLPEARQERELEALAARDPELATWVRELLLFDEPEPVEIPGDEPRSFGPYEVVRPIGRGGMGEVFVARRADGEYESEVAVKLLRDGTANRELVRRFLRERQTLARLDHEYIARLLDGGTTPSGEPYLVMEYVEGEPADVFAARLELRERLELFIRIGRAVAHAHERGFVHRDLKPSNVLVRPDGTPRLLDFGIARPEEGTQALFDDDDPLTRTGQRIFTPEYASPEQVRGEVATARSDVFALGVILYLFLSGKNPWASSASLHELERNICETDATPPSRLVTGTTRSRISGDLDAVVLQCLAKRPERRYGSVAELCEDLERHLAGLPIRARRTGVLGRAARFARRKPAYAVGGVFLLVALMAAWWAWDSERHGERRRAELSAAVSDRIEVARKRWGDGELDDAEEQLDAAMAALRELPEEKQLEARVLAQRAVFANAKGDWSRSLDLFDRARPLLDEVDDPDPQLTAILLNTRAFALTRAEAGERSREAARVALEFARENLEPGDVLRSDALLGWADELRLVGETEATLAILEEAVNETRARDPKGEGLSRFLNDMALELKRAGRLEEAVDAYGEALEILAWHRGEGHPAVAKVSFNLGSTLFSLGRFEEAREVHERSLAAARATELEPLVVGNQHFLGRIHYALGDYEAAEAPAREATEVCERNGWTNDAARSRCLLGMVQARLGRTEEARATLTPLLEEPAGDVLLPEMEAEAQHRLGALLDDAGEPDAARPHLERALALKRAQLGPEHADCLELADRLGE